MSVSCDPLSEFQAAIVSVNLAQGQFGHRNFVEGFGFFGGFFELRAGVGIPLVSGSDEAAVGLGFGLRVAPGGCRHGHVPLE